MFKTKIIVIGYVALSTLLIVGIVRIYAEWLNDMETSLPQSRYQKELVALSNTLATLYHAEGTAGLLAVASDSLLASRYDSLTLASLTQITSLKQISEEQELTGLLDSLHTLLLQKKERTTELVKLARLYAADTLKQHTKTILLPRYQLEQLNRMLDTLEQVQDTTVVVGEKKNLFRRIGEAIKSSGHDTLLTINSHSTLARREWLLPVVRDTIVDIIREINVASQRRHAAITSQLLLKQSQLYQINERTTAQIARIMDEWEENELKDKLRAATEREAAIRRSSVEISVIALAAILVAVFFLSWILRSLSVNQRLNLEIQITKQHLETLLASRERLMLTITHDIKAPIGSILGYLELMLKGSPPMHHRYLENMQQSAIHIRDLASDLLDLNALENDEQQPDLLVFSPHDLLSDIYKSFIPASQKKAIRFDFQSEAETGAEYLGDPYRIRQIVNNIVSNAIKYTPDGGSVILSARLLCENPKQTELYIAVQDSGPGIKPGDRQRIFEAFKRLNGANKGIEGFGLGLYIALKTAHLLRGSITVNSSVGEGSVFAVRLPLDSAPSSVVLAAAGRPIDVLFIDDDTALLDLVAAIAQQAGMNPHTCCRASEALQRVREQAYDIIFSDIQMPDASGFELAKQIRSAGFEGADVVPIVGLSAHSQVSRTQYAEAGFSDFLTKPITSDQLIQTIRRHTGRPAADFSQNTEITPGFEQLIAFANNDREAGEAILRSFIADNREHSRALEQAFARNDWETVRSLAHRMLPLMKITASGQLTFLLEQYNAGSRNKKDRALLLTLIQAHIQKAEHFIETQTSI
jgi:signal transduction histidine kinase/DNA-binding response OmpR family regulator